MLRPQQHPGHHTSTQPDSGAVGIDRAGHVIKHDKFVGAATQEQLLEVIRHARHVCAESAAGAPPVLALDL